MNPCFKAILWVALLFFCSPAFSQSRSELEKQKSKLKEELEYKSLLLGETQASKKKSINQLALLDNKIRQRETLIQTIRQEIGLINQKISETQSIIQALEADLKVLKEEYAKMVFFAYKNRSGYDRLMFIFASEDFNQAYKRIKYLQQYSRFRKRQAEIILITQSELERKTRELQSRRAEKDKLLQSQEDEKNYLAQEKGQKKTLVASLSEKEKELKDEIEKKRKEAEKKSGNFGLTPEAQALSNDFKNNQSKLPWPVSKGVITDRFGEHPHPVLRGIKIQNNGIDISTNKGETARAVFAGEVSSVIVIPGAGKAVLVRHGEYLTVYSNLQEVYVQKGDKVEIKQNLGVVLTDPDKNETKVHFEIWQGKTTLDPSSWIFKGS